MKIRLLLFHVVTLCAISCTSQSNHQKHTEPSSTKIIPFDDVRPGHWPDPFELVQIPSKMDDSLQRAWYYPTTASNPQPLLISLHTWSGDYNQKDTLAFRAMEKDWNYVHPDFRGPNWTPKACCSDYAIEDIDQAIDYAIENGNVDKSRIYVNGVSGGGYAALAVYMRSRHPIKNISAWVPISDLSAWYDQSVERGNDYGTHILQCTESTADSLNREEARKRSPINWETPIRPTRLQIYAGVHDGIEGSVPITQSIRFYNKVLKDLNVEDPKLLVTSEEITHLLEKRKPVTQLGKLGERNICLQKNYEKIRLIIFDGGHEMLSDVAFQTLDNQ